jgi:hypothetical protein
MNVGDSVRLQVYLNYESIDVAAVAFGSARGRCSH